jgi:hypothetical protein
MIQAIRVALSDKGKVTFPKSEKQAFLLGGERAQVTQEINLIIEKMCEAIFFQVGADFSRGCRTPEDLLYGVSFDDRVRITGALAQVSKIFHVDEKDAALQWELPVYEPVHGVGRDHPHKEFITGFKADYNIKWANLREFAE